MTEINTHGMRIEFGKHGPQPDRPEGELFTRLPLGYLKWMANERTRQWEIAKAELERRGDTMPKVEISGHAIDNASLRVRKIWHETRGPDEGLYSWLQRMTLEAIEKGEKLDNGAIRYQGIKFVVAEGAEFPALITVMR